MRIRTFVAVKINDETYNELYDNIKRVSGSKDLAWENRDKSHLTLKFIKEFDTVKLPKLINSLKDVVETNKSFKLNFSEISAFYRNNLPVIIYAGFRKNKSLEKLYSEINDMFAKFDVKKEKRLFKPHLTLLRIKKNMNIKNINEYLIKDISNIEFRVNEIYLIKSELTSKGAIYSDIEKFYLN